MAYSGKWISTSSLFRKFNLFKLVFFCPLCSVDSLPSDNKRKGRERGGNAVNIQLSSVSVSGGGATFPQLSGEEAHQLSCILFISDFSIYSFQFSDMSFQVRVDTAF